MDKELKGYLRVKHYNRKLERFYYYLSLAECKYIKERLEKSMFNISFNNVSKTANSDNVDYSDLAILYLDEIKMLRSAIKIKEDTILTTEHTRIEGIRKRCKKKLKRKFI